MCDNGGMPECRECASKSYPRKDSNGATSTSASRPQRCSVRVFMGATRRHIYVYFRPIRHLRQYFLRLERSVVMCVLLRVRKLLLNYSYYCPSAVYVPKTHVRAALNFTHIVEKSLPIRQTRIRYSSRSQHVALDVGDVTYASKNASVQYNSSSR